MEHIVFYGLNLLDLALYEDSWVEIMNEDEKTLSLCPLKKSRLQSSMYPNYDMAYMIYSGLVRSANVSPFWPG